MPGKADHEYGLLHHGHVAAARPATSVLSVAARQAYDSTEAAQLCRTPWHVRVAYLCNSSATYMLVSAANHLTQVFADVQAEALDGFSALAELAELAETNPDPPTEAEHGSKRQRVNVDNGTAQESSDRSTKLHQTPSKAPDPLEAACQDWLQQLQQQQEKWQQRCQHLLKHGGAKVCIASRTSFTF